MKKIIVLFFVAVMCFSLVACGGETTDANDNNGAQQETEQPDSGQESGGQVGGSQTSDSDAISKMKDKIAETEKCIAIIRVQINPAFDIYLDENNLVLAVECLNDDAKQILSGIDVNGQNGMDALQILVTAVLRTEIAKNAVVYITPVCQEENSLTSELINDIPLVLSQLQTSLQLDGTITVEFDDDGIVEEQENNNNEVTEGEEEDDDREVIKDENGNIIKTVQVDEAGNTLIQYYHSSGYLTREVIEYKNGEHRETEFDQSGNTIRITTDYVDGSHIESIFTNGKITKSVRIDVHGSVTETSYDGNGKPLLTTGTSSDGGTIEWRYHENGELKEAIQRYADGSYNMQTFDENGIKLTQESVYANGSGTLIWSKFLYDSDGNVTEYFGQDNFGRPVHKIYNSDGSSVTYRTETDGSVTAIYYDSNGNIIHP